MPCFCTCPVHSPGTTQGRKAEGNRKTARGRGGAHSSVGRSQVPEDATGASSQQWGVGDRGHCPAIGVPPRPLPKQRVPPLPAALLPAGHYFWRPYCPSTRDPPSPSPCVPAIRSRPGACTVWPVGAPVASPEGAQGLVPGPAPPRSSAPWWPPGDRTHIPAWEGSSRLPAMALNSVCRSAHV